MKGFKAYDIRGVYGKDFNEDDAYKIGFFLPRLLNTDAVLVGRDVRSSSESLFSALSAGITDAGADVYDMGLATTPMVYFGTAHFGFGASVQITASHNPKEYNGFKVSKAGALPVGYESGLSDLQILVENEVPQPARRKGEVKPFEVRETYEQFLASYVPESFGSLDVTVDCSNGMRPLMLQELLGDRRHHLYDKPAAPPPHRPGRR